MTRGVLFEHPHVYLQLGFVADGRPKEGGTVGFVGSLSLWNNLGQRYYVCKSDRGHWVHLL